MRSFLNITTVMIIIMGVVMAGSSGCSSSGIRYEKYSSKDTELNITGEYIADWQYKEIRGPYKSYVEVLFYEPKKDKDFKAAIALTIEDASKLNIAPAPAGADAFAADLLSKRLLFKDSKLLSRGAFKVLNTEAVDMKFSYKTVDKLYSTDAKLIPVTERVVILKIGTKFYTIRYQNTGDEFDKYDSAFTHILKTLKVKSGL